ncbi:hypothetical protein JW964_04530 [candidate division KSB1 bacterium]|nr:hypothetical protein [candidate division KSB1 bacterium]
MQQYQPQKIYFESTTKEYTLTRQILNHYSDIPVEEIKNPRQLVHQILQHPDPITYGKQFLLISRQKARFLKKCPGTRNYICCGYKILNTANNCHLDCTYCILQGYFNNPLMVVYVNIEDLLTELREQFELHPNKFYRIGTGELTDSLILEPVTQYGEKLVRFFKDFPNAIIELKTKSVNIDNLLELKHNRRAVISWSLNSESIQQREEALSPSIDERLAAAKKCQEAGYWLGFHFDPIIYYDNWEKDYFKTVEKIFSVIDGKNIAWISLGALRYPTSLDGIIRQRHPESPIVYGEFISGKDQKLRYFKPIRIQVFKKMVEWIRDFDPSVFVYLCMESSEVWKKAFGWTPERMSTLSRLLDERVK